MSYDLDEYGGYYTEDHENAEFAKILSTGIAGSDLTEEEEDLFRDWLPSIGGEHLLQAYRDHSQNVIKQRVEGSWHEAMEEVIGKLIMTPDNADPFSLTNTNPDVNNVSFDLVWKITSWRTRVTKSLSYPFEPTNAKPVLANGNLLCEEIIFERINPEKKVIMLYGWNAW